MKNYLILVLSLVLAFMFIVANWQREYIVAQDARLTAFSQEQSCHAWDYISGSTSEWSLCWSNSVNHPVEVIHFEGSRITEHWSLGGGITTNIWQMIPPSQYPWSHWNEAHMIHPHDPWGDWLVVQERTNLVDGAAEMRVVFQNVK